MISADARVLRRFASGLRGRVHSVFAHVVNAEHENGALVTLASRDSDNAPDTAIVDIGRFAGTGVAPGDPFAATATTLGVGPLEIALAGARNWTASLPASPIDIAALRANLEVATARLKRLDAQRARTPNGPDDDFVRDAILALSRHASSLIEALMRRDVDGACVAAEAMVGLGPGLTPSGDDYLVGLFATLNLPRSPYRPMRVVGRRIVATALARTNAISAAALANAAQGRVRDSIAGLLRALTEEGQPRVGPALERVLGIGSTSGRDIASGIMAGLALLLSSPRSLHLPRGTQAPR